MKTGATASSGASPAIVRQTDSYVIIVPNEKGGVGKTMLTLSLAAHTVAAHGRALVADIDPHANAHDLTQVMTDPGYDVLHELDPMELKQIRRVRDYDVVLVDCPGSLKGNVVLDEALAHSDYAVIPYNHQPESVMPTIRTVERVKAAGVPYAVVLTKADPRLGADHITDVGNPGGGGYPAFPVGDPDVPGVAQQFAGQGADHLPQRTVRTTVA